MQSSISIARATATLPRNWSKNIGRSHAILSDPRYNKRQEGANKTRLILQKYLERGIDPSPDLLDSLDPTNLSYDGSLSASSSCAGSLTALIIEPTSTTPKQGRRSKNRASDDQRCQLVRKQKKRQSILPSFFEPDNVPHMRAQSSPGPTLQPAKLTVAALSAHDHPVAAFLAPKPVISGKFVRRATSFQVLPTIRIIKPVPECLDDHSNPSSRDPFYYDKVLKKMDSLASLRQASHDATEGTHDPQDYQIVHGRDSQDSVDSGSVTAWFADQYLGPAQ